MRYSDAYSNIILYSWSPKERYPTLDFKNAFFVSDKRKQKGLTINKDQCNGVYKKVSIVALIIKNSALCRELFSI